MEQSRKNKSTATTNNLVPRVSLERPWEKKNILESIFQTFYKLTGNEKKTKTFYIHSDERGAKQLHVLRSLT